VVDETVTRPVSGLESACSEIARELLARHPYATQASVEASAEYFLRKGISEEKRSFEDYTLIAEARARRAADGSVALSRSVGAEAVGMTACPCAMETCRDKLTAQFPLLASPDLKGLPMITHNQRNRTRVIFDLEDSTEVEADDVIAAIEAAQSSPTYAILKRGDEADVVINAHLHPKFVEDVLRDLLASLPSRFPGVSDSAVVRASTVSE
ncbi:MAG TPA: GTP cyclohydrolase, FolE2/MptA family, partial [Thermoplasmata archaeon]|nr:GTP cyclohydrolase, FolE2/MptA family [Thermoplasmata archaeon]